MKCSDRQVYGVTTVNDKGQVVIPADARKALGIETDMKMMVIGHTKHKVVILMPTGLFEKKMQGLMGLFFRSEDSA